MRNNKVQIMAISALLCAIGIVIPMFAPKIMLEPVSYTLASHVPIFIAMFISPIVAISVAIITGFGFLFAGFPIVIVFRALTHVVFATIGAFILSKYKTTLQSKKKTALFAFLVSVIHAIGEVIVVTVFYFGNNVTSGFYDKGYLVTVIGFVGIGTIIHSMIDFGIATVVWKPLSAVVNIPVSAKFKKA